MLITFRPKICETERLEASSWPEFVRRLVGGRRVGDPREFYFWRFDKCTLESSAAAGAGLEFFIGREFLIFLSLWRLSSISGSYYFRTKMILIMRKGEKDMEWRLTSIYQVIKIHTLRFLVHTFSETHGYHCVSEIVPCWDYPMKSIILHCRSLFEVKLFTDQVRPALGSVGPLVGSAQRVRFFNIRSGRVGLGIGQNTG